MVSVSGCGEGMKCGCDMVDLWEMSEFDPRAGLNGEFECEAYYGGVARKDNLYDLPMNQSHVLFLCAACLTDQPLTST